MKIETSGRKAPFFFPEHILQIFHQGIELTIAICNTYAKLKFEDNACECQVFFILSQRKGYST